VDLTWKVIATILSFSCGL